MANRRNQIRNNISGGTSAPRSAAMGPASGLGSRKPVPAGQWNPKGETKGTAFARGAGAPSAAPGAPGGPAQQTPMPWDVAAANDEGAAYKRFGNSITGLDAGWQTEQQEFGLDPGFNDYASNPYSRSALLQRSYDNAKRGTLNSAGQQLYAGSYVNAQNANTHGFNLGRDELEKAYARDHAGYISDRQNAGDELQGSLSQAGWDRINAGLEAEPEPMPAEGGGSGGGGSPGGGGALKTAKKKPQAAKAFAKKIK